MITKWAHLPNAKQIDAVLEHAKRYPDKWSAVWGADYDAAWYAAYDESYDAAYDAAWDAALNAARDEAWYAAWHSARDAGLGADRDAVRAACLALIAWDDASQLLTLPIDAVPGMAKKGNPAAILLLPAKLAMEEV